MDIVTHCMSCNEYLDGPCFDHTDVKRIVFDKAPVPLAYSSLPDVLRLDSVAPYAKEKTVSAKEEIEAGTLFGPLIAPLYHDLLPLDETEQDARPYSLWLEEAQQFQAYDLSDDFLCNWIKFVRPSYSMAEANVVAYQQRGFIYLVAVRDILPPSELRVYIKPPSCATVRECYQLPAVAPTPGLYSPATVRVSCSEPEENSEPPGKKPRKIRNKSAGKEVEASVVQPEMDVKQRTLHAVSEDQGVSAIQPASYSCDKPDYRPVECGVSSVEHVQKGGKIGAISGSAEDVSLGSSSSSLKSVLADGEKSKRVAGTRVEYKVPIKTLPHWLKLSTRALRQENPKRAEGKVERKKVPQKHVRRADNNKGTTNTIRARAPRPRPLTDMEEEIRRKLIAGIALTAEEQLRREQDLVHRRASNEKRRRKDRIAKGRDPEPLKNDNPGAFKKAPLFAWQLAEQESSSASSK